MRASPSSSLNRLIGWLGGWIGFVLIAVGLIVLALWLFLRMVPDAVAPLPLDLPSGGLSIWLGVVPLLLGGASYIWGRGMLRFRAWAPFVAAIFLFNLALYLALFGIIVTRKMITPPVWMLRDWQIYRTMLQAGVAVAAIVLLLLVALLLFGPGGLRAAYVLYHRTKPSAQLATCPTCRSIIERADGTCSWCEPRLTEARLELIGAQPGQGPFPLLFSRDQNRLIVGRRTPGRPPTEAGHMLLDPAVSADFETISAAHAAFAYDSQSRQFAIEDLGGLNGTRLIHNQVVTSLALQKPSPLADGDIVEMGDARFTFRIVSLEAS